MRIAIVGGPRTGKTTLAGKGDTTGEGGMVTMGEGGTIWHTDDLIDLGWSKSSEAASKWFNQFGPWVIEGVAVSRALRKWLAANPEGKPCDLIILLWMPYEELTHGQKSMAKGVKTVWRGILSELRVRGVKIVAPV